MLVQNGIEPILQLTCRDRNRIALQSDLIGAAALGVRNLLMLRGDDPTAGDQPDAKPVFDLDPRALLDTAAGMRDAASCRRAARSAGAPIFSSALPTMPIDPPPGWEPNGLKAKIAAGAQFVQTQFCMDMDVVRRYMARLAERGIADKLYMLIGIAPLRSAKSARWMQGEALRRHHPRRDRRSHGARRAIRRRRAAAFASTWSPRSPTSRMSPACHVMAPGNDAAVAGIIAAARYSVSRLAVV